MSKLVDDSVATQAFIDWLATILAPHQILVGDADAPAAATAPRFIEVRQLPDGEIPSGGWAQPLGVRGLKYQLRSVGTARREAQWIMARAREALFEYHPSGFGYLNAIPVPKHEIVHREMVSDLGYVDSGRAGGHLTHIRLRTQRTQD